MDLLVPQLSSTMETARVIRWLKKQGDSVRTGEPLVEVETDKSAMDVESPADGVLSEVLVREGEEVAVGGSLGRLTEVPAAAMDERIKMSPLARRLAAEAGIDLKTVQGTGPN